MQPVKIVNRVIIFLNDAIEKLQDSLSCLKPAYNGDHSIVEELTCAAGRWSD